MYHIDKSRSGVMVAEGMGYVWHTVTFIFVTQSETHPSQLKKVIANRELLSQVSSDHRAGRRRRRGRGGASNGI